MIFPSLIMDSGVVFLSNKYVKKEGQGSPGVYLKDKRKVDFSFYNSKIFKDYRESYIKFVLKNGKYLYAYVNMDIIHNAEMSYESLKYMEKKGCHPLPVFHLGNDTKWLQRYVDEGYDFICIGGITPNPYKVLKPVLDRVWKNILTDKQGMPILKVHGLGCTAYQLLVRYPWYSVDSATWTKLAAWGAIYVPRKVNGIFDFSKTPFAIKVSEDSPYRKRRRVHLFTVAEGEKKHIEEWLKFINVPMGNSRKKGIINHYEYRMKANLLFFQALTDYLPKWPWRFKPPLRKGLF